MKTIYRYLSTLENQLKEQRNNTKYSAMPPTDRRTLNKQKFISLNRVFSPNSGCLLNIGNGPQSGPALYSKAKGREAAYQFIMGPKAAKWPINS